MREAGIVRDSLFHFVEQVEEGLGPSRSGDRSSVEFLSEFPTGPAELIIQGNVFVMNVTSPMKDERD